MHCQARIRVTVSMYVSVSEYDSLSVYDVLSAVLYMRTLSVCIQE